MKILVIDDEKPTLSMFKLFLTAYGFDVETARDGETGLERFHELKPDIVFTDIKMPGMDGLEVLKKIRETDTQVQVIIITGHGDMDKAIQALDLDASDFINKPVERQALDSALNRAEKRHAMKGPAAFTLKALDFGPVLGLRLSGKLTGLCRETFEQEMNTALSEGTAGVAFILDPSFSINRTGLAFFTTILQDLKQRGIELRIENLSYNYNKVFQMAGLDKLADLVREKTG